MLRDDYRRALILLRGNTAGASGHVRLERRTLTGSMYFLVQMREEAAQLRASLVGRGRDGYFACPLGELCRDRRGQYALGYSFDPRKICGRALEQYQLIVISDDQCRIVLYGNVDGHANLNWEGVRAAVCALYADGIARDGAAQEQPADDAAQTEQPSAAKSAEEAPPNVAADGEDPSAAADSEEDAGEASAAEASEEGEAPLGTPEQPASEEEGAAEPAQPEPAGAALGIDLSLPWPERFEMLRSLFQSQPALSDVPDDAYVYVATDLPADCGYPYCAAGVRTEGGEVVSVRYALPSAWSAEPPAGMEEYAWIGDQNKGWWTIEVPAAEADTGFSAE